MPLPRKSTVLRPAIRLALLAWAIAGCGGASGPSSMAPISVSLASSKIIVSQDGKPAAVQILIMSTSETALVNFRGIPGGVKTMYAASDTSPSGLLTFTATASAQAGTYTPFITVNSAGQMATISFTLVVAPATSG